MASLPLPLNARFHCFCTVQLWDPVPETHAKSCVTCKEMATFVQCNVHANHK